MATSRSTRASRRMPLPVRAQVALALVLFVATTSVVIWRRSVGVSTGRAMERLREERRTLEADRVTYEARWRRAIGRAEVVQQAERRLGMHVASELETRTLVVPGTAPERAVAADSAPPGGTP